MIELSSAVVHPWLCDTMGHLTTRNYLAMFDDASYVLFYKVFGYIPNSSDWWGKGWADIKQTIEYKSELFASDMVRIEGEVCKIGNKSVTSKFVMKKIHNNDVAATLESTSVYFDLEKRQAIEIPNTMRSNSHK